MNNDITKLVRPIILECFGGKCQLCGYDKYKSVLHLHHIHPEQKTHSFDNNLYWDLELLKVELRKCILLCSNCHMAIHTGCLHAVDGPHFNEAKLKIVYPVKHSRVFQLKFKLPKSLSKPPEDISLPLRHREWLSMV
jgi:5-methylcytosine-specific restriction endonuclease McrA